MRFSQHIERKLININRIETVASKITMKETDRNRHTERERYFMSDTFFHELYELRLNLTQASKITSNFTL
jgi:hypothetical protein